MYASQWFLSFFATNLKYETMIRIVDVFLLEGHKVFYKVAIAILKLNEEKILNAKQLEDIMNIFKAFYGKINADKLFEIALNLNITKTLLNVDIYFILGMGSSI
jgi:hypothetical protein